jgi:outer membrane protein OmpA-like peptidoglycan-associated protein
MRKLIFVVLLAALMVAGCGASKGYVDEQIAAAEARMNSQVSTVSSKADANAAEVAKLKDLAAQLQEKTDMAINKAAGFENYQIIWSGEINFAFDSYALDNVSTDILTEAGQKLEGTPNAIVELAGHCDRTGSKTYNYELGQMRAAEAQRFFAERFGIQSYRMFIISYGKDKPQAAPDEKYSASKNRRVNLTIWAPPQ